MRHRIACLFAWLSFAWTPFPVAADGSELGLSYVETPDVKLIYFDGLSYLSPHALRTFTNALAWQKRMFGWLPSEPTVVLLTDFSDVGHAAVWAAPQNTLFLDVSPVPHAFETNAAIERMFSLMNHELVHVATSDVAGPEEKRWRRFFLGKVPPQAQHPETLLYSYLTIPRFTVPRWYLEGGAVFLDTWMAGGLGRAQGGFDEMVFRTMVRDGVRFYDPLGLASRGVRVEFLVGANAYLYGTRFFTWLAYAHSPEKVVEWLKRGEGSERYYADEYRRLFGTSLDEGWRQWVAFEHDFQRRNLAEVRKQPITPHRQLGSRALGSMSRVHFDEATGTLYGAFRYPGVVEHVGALDVRTGSIRHLADVKRAQLYRVASFAFDPATGTAFYTDDNLAMRDLMAVDVESGESRMLLENARIGELAFNHADRSLMGVRHSNGFATLVQIPYPYNGWIDIHTFPYGSVPYDLDISPDGRLLSASMSEVDAEQYLRVWPIARLLVGDTKPLSEFRFGQSVPESFVFSPDGRYLFGSSYYTGVSNIFRYEVATGTIAAVSNAETGFFRPAPLADGRLVVLNYTGQGFVPAIIDARPIEDVSAITFLGAEVAAKHPIVTKWQVPPPSTVDEEKLITGTGAYDPPRNVQLVNAFPVLQGYKDSVGVGWHFNFEDRLRFAQVGVTAAITPDGDLSSDERFHFEIFGKYLGWRAELSWNRSDFYDLFGPTKRSRKGFAGKLGYDWLIIFDDPRKLTMNFDIALYTGIDTLPEAQNVPTQFSRLLTGEVGIRYENARRSIGAVDDEKGIITGAVATMNRVNGETLGQLRGNLDYGFALPIPNSSIWIRTALGAASGDRDNSVALFYFGGFGNNYVDSREVKRYREYYSLPGFGINEVSGLSFVRPMLEWNLPPVIFESVGTPGFHLSWLRPAVFASALWTDPERSTFRRDYASVGAQVDLHFSVLHWSHMTLSAGYAVGFREGRRAGTEWMLSLKIL
jgi:hypothetical protein